MALLKSQDELPWQYDFPPFFTLQPHPETRNRQIAVWRKLVLSYFQSKKQCVIDVREARYQPIFTNTAINRRLDTEFLLAILSDLQRTQNAAPVDKQQNCWEIYWHTLEEWALIIYEYISTKGFTNSVFTLFELIQGEEIQEEFCCLNMDIIIKILRILESEKKCELILTDDHQGVKFF